jgi:hypothetical protein
MLQMLIYLFFRNGQALGEFQGGVKLLLEQLFEGLAYRQHVKPALLCRFCTGPLNDKNSINGFFVGVKFFKVSQKIESTVTGMGTGEIEEYSGIKSKKGLNPRKLVKIFEQKNDRSWAEKV